MTEFEGKIALVTGAGRGIGKAVALALAAAGTNIISADIDLSMAEGTASDVADLVLYLVKARHVTGQAINVDGGMEMH